MTINCENIIFSQFIIYSTLFTVSFPTAYNRAAVSMGIIITQWDYHWYGYGMEMGTVMNPIWACGDSVGIWNRCEIKRKGVKHAINIWRCLNFAKYSPIFIS